MEAEALNFKRRRLRREIDEKFLQIALAAVFSMSLLLGLVSCASEEGSQEITVPGDQFDAGNVSALCPEGWMAFPISDLFDEYPGNTDPNGIRIHKGASNDMEQLSTPGIQINYYGPGSAMSLPNREFYENPQTIEPMEIGQYSWRGFSGFNGGIPMTVLWAESGEHQFQVIITTAMEGKTIALEDAEVQAIIQSIKPKE